MTTLLIVLAIVLGYLGVGAVLARVAWRLHHASLDHPSKTVAVLLGWPFLLAGLGVVALTDGIHDVVTRPTDNERLEQRRAALEHRIAGLERDLELGADDPTTAAPPAGSKAD